jgi:hypothetical protein
MKALLLAFLICFQFGSPQQPAPASAPDLPHSPEINTTLMESTFLIVGPPAKPGEEGRNRFGTCFVMLRRLKADSDMGQYTIVTAKHVFEDIKGEQAVVMLRKLNAVGDTEPLPFNVKIRDRSRNLYTSHPSADVAAIDVALPNDTTVVQLGPSITNIDWLATDEFLKDIRIHPGDELDCLGYPLGLSSNDAGYPILGSGKIASYPVIPLKRANKILYRFQAQPGNSGGPVYLAFTGRPFKDKIPFGRLMTYQKLFGLVVEKVDSVGNIDPSVAVIVPSVYIKETLDILSGFESTIKEDQ